MKRQIIYIISLMVTLFCMNGANAHSTSTLRLAVFDNPRIDPEDPKLSQRIFDAYVEGMKTALYVAKKQGVEINEQSFFYGQNLIDIAQKVPYLLQWQPDAIIGLHNSNQMLMSRSFFNDILTLSTSASDVEIEQLPKNFYSLGVPDSQVAEKIIAFINQKYPNRNIFLAIQADSKESFDMADFLSKQYKTLNPKIKISHGEFSGDEMKKINMNEFLKNYSKNDVIILLSIVYSSQKDLMNRIADYLSSQSLVFISYADNWEPQTSSFKKNLSYDAYRITFDLENKSQKSYKQYVKSFEIINKKKPTYVISYIVYQTIMSIVTAMKEFPALESMHGKEAVLYSYHEALKKDPNWFRSRKQIVYKIEADGEVYLETLK